MNYFHSLDKIMKQDFGGRGLLASLPESPLEETALALRDARHVILLTGFPVRRPNSSYIGETDGPSGTANLAAALTALGCRVTVVTDRPSYALLEAALRFRAPKSMLILLPELNPRTFIRHFVSDSRPTHFISLERPGKARDGHYYNMRGQIIDDMITDSDLFLSMAKKAGAVTISIGDGGNEMGMGAFREQIEAGVPYGERLCAFESADYPLASGVSNWWGWGIASLLSVMSGQYLLPNENTETELLSRVVEAGGIDGATKEHAMTVDSLPLSVHLDILRQTAALTRETMTAVGKRRMLPVEI